jgi:hypothetical protein
MTRNSAARYVILEVPNNVALIDCRHVGSRCTQQVHVTALSASASTIVLRLKACRPDPGRRLRYTLRDAWRNYALKLTLKPVIDWGQDGATGAVMELEVA